MNFFTDTTSASAIMLATITTYSSFHLSSPETEPGGPHFDRHPFIRIEAR